MINTNFHSYFKIDFRSDDIAVLNLQLISEGTVRKLVIERTYVHHEGQYMCVTESNDKTAGELFVKGTSSLYEKVGFQIIFLC